MESSNKRVYGTVSKLGVVLRRYRLDNKIKSKKFADDVGLPYIYLYRIETNETAISEPFFIRMLVYFISRNKLTDDIKEALENRVSSKAFIKNINTLFKSKTLITILSSDFNNRDINPLLDDLKKDMTEYKPICEEESL